MFRGEFVGLNGGADFYAKDIDSLHKEGEISLKVFFRYVPGGWGRATERVFWQV